MQETLAFIGAGNMASSLIGGLIADGYPATKIWATDTSAEKLQNLKKTFGIHISEDNHEAVKHASVVIFAVKPQVLKKVVKDLANTLNTKNPLIISIAAMITAKHIEQWLKEKFSIVRCMPNTPALVRSGVTGLFANSYVTQQQKNLAESIMRAVGVTLWIEDETLMDTISILSGSGPAYFFYLMEVLQESAEKLGLSHDAARLLVLETALGASRLALDSKHDVKILRQQVTSPGGITERAFEVLQQAELPKYFFAALKAGKERSAELSEELKD